MSTQLIFLLLFSLAALSCRAQTSNARDRGNFDPKKEIGNFYHKNYSSKDYNASFQNWGGLQDRNGVMFFSNGDGILSYDGKTWSLTETPTMSVVRSMAMDENGKIFVGALDDFGYLARLPNGKHVFISLLDKLKPALYGMGNIWQTFLHNHLVYFEAESGLFCWNGERFTFLPWHNPNVYHKSFFWNDELYVYEEGIGLMQLKNDKFKLAPSGDFFKTKRIYATIPLSTGKILLASRYDGLFLYDGFNPQRFQTHADSFFKENQIYTGIVLRDSTYVFGTRLGGAAMIDRQGHVLYMFNKENGLPTNVALGLSIDHEGNLWISNDNGISKFEINNRLSLYDTGNGLEGSINDFSRHNNILYTATSMGLYALRPSAYPAHHSRFERVPQIRIRCWNLLTVNNGMLVSSDDGMYELHGDRIQKITGLPSHAMHVYKNDSSRIVVALNNELQILKFVNGRWTEAGFIKDVKLDNISFNETHPGKIWMSTYSQGAALLSFPEQNGTIDYDHPTIKYYGIADGLPEGFIKMNSIDGKEIFRVGTASRIFRFDYSTYRFKEDTAFAAKFGLESDGVFPITDDNSSGSFLFKTKQMGKNKRQLILVRPSSSNAYSVDRFDISRIFENVHVNSFLENNIIWQGGADGIVRYEIAQLQKPKTFKTYVNKIILEGDSVFLQGVNGVKQNLTFPYSSNSFRFEFTSTNFAAEEANEFQYKLEGYDDEWSGWTSENVKEYSRLWEGNYKFSVRSRNFAEEVGTTDEFSFVVAAPWFRSFYAYAAYFVGVAFLVWGFVRWRLYSLLKEKEALQAEVAHQTQEIRQQNIQLAEQSEELKINAEQLKELDKMKSNFFVNISHEFRTPLSLILSPLEKFIQEKALGQIRLTEIERMHRNAKRLQQLINQLLDLAKLESGGMKLNPKQSDFFYFLRVLTASFESLAESRNIQFEVDIPVHSYEASFDNDKVETVLYNLLSNAFKFTPDGGIIRLQVKLPKDDNGQCLAISISDTGPGIPVGELDKIFDRFYQVDSSSSREFEGSGIGLSLVKELVILMNGNITVESSLGMGATFRVNLPLPGTIHFDVSKNSFYENGVSVAADELLIPADQEKEEGKVLPENAVAPAESLVLLVEDNADLRSYLTESLADEYEIVVAENGQTGLEKAIELSPDLILSDMMMPVMDGFTLCTKIRSDERISHIPFVLLTARTTIESKLEGLELGADEYITKPFNMKELKVRIKNLLEQRRNLRKNFSREVTIQPKNISVTSIDERFLNHALEIMYAHLADQQFSVERFAEEIGMSRKNLLRKIKALTDQSVNEFIRNFRLQRAAQLISGKTATISEIAYQVGFNNLSYFSKCFKELFGVLPNEYANKHSVRINHEL